MTLIDANRLIYAHVVSLPQHERAREWLDSQLNGHAPVGLPWSSLLAFLRLVTNPRVFEQPEPIASAWEQVRAWLAGDVVWIPQPGKQHAELLGELLALPGIQANLVPDADLAALALEYGLTLYSTDGDFARFPRLRWVEPAQLLSSDGPTAAAALNARIGSSIVPIVAAAAQGSVTFPAMLLLVGALHPYRVATTGAVYGSAPPPPPW